MAEQAAPEDTQAEVHLYWDAIRRFEDEAGPPRPARDQGPQPAPAGGDDEPERQPSTDRAPAASPTRRPPRRQREPAGPVKKTREFYRRRGALWTDLYHTPKQRLHLVNHRPDLDARHEEYVRRREAEEADAARREVRRRRNVRKNEVATLQHQRYRNLNRHLPGTVRMQTPPAKPARPLSSRGRPETTKDRFFFRRTGNLWSDYAHLPEQRRHLVVRPDMVENDERAFERILARMEQDDEDERLRAEARLAKVHAVRDEFVRRREENLEKEAEIFRNAPKQFVPQHSAARRPQSAGPRVDELAKPKARGHGATEKPFAHSDFRGLLGSDLTIRSQLSSLRGAKERAVSCPLPYHTGTAGQRGRGVAERLLEEQERSLVDGDSSASDDDFGVDNRMRLSRLPPVDPQERADVEASMTQLDWFDRKLREEGGLQGGHGSINYAAMLE